MRKIIKRSVVVLLAGVLLFSLSGCKKKQKKDEVQRYAWPLGTSSPEDTVTQLYAEKFAKEVSKLSHGKMKIEVYPNSTLGGDRELLESCKDGDIPFVVQNTAPQVTFLPDTAVFDLPSAFTTIQQARAAVDNEEFYQKIGWFPFPAIEGSDADPSIMIGTVGDQFIVFNCEGEKLEAAFECAEDHLSDEVIDIGVESGKIPPVNGIEDKLTDPITIEVVEAANNASEIQLWYDQYLPPAVSNAHLDGLQEVFGLTMTPQEAQESMQQAMEEYNAQKAE